jgi:hypothetical protein
VIGFDPFVQLADLIVARGERRTSASRIGAVGARSGSRA